ncbi:tRNA lysidine(34) synthetase TilS [Phenylobacterium sp.]|uniref:tRNA lysidine(34) synthetase TilS n=1 Tax=Phenylobacterium sp. TaxID=1871053 RepID=UPI002F42C500
MRLNEVDAVLRDHLLAHDPAPVAVAFSGGGDSLALLLAAHAWARANGRALLTLTLDHRLQAGSAAWAAACAATARRLGVACRTLAWTGPKPERGLPAAARAARHQRLADAAREAGARVLLMGHTADDVLEARAMRRAGATTPEPRVWTPSPAWPEGRGLFLLRPLLGQRRAAIRGWLQARGESWIDDPANTDLRYARPRARAGLTDADAPKPPAAPADAAPLARAACMDAGGGLSVARELLRAAERPAGLRFLSAACLCAAGTNRPPRGDRLQWLAAQATGPAAFVSTLAGARIEGGEAELRFSREPGEAARGGLSPLSLPAGEAVVWDGRFELISAGAGLTVGLLAGRRKRLSPAEQRALATLAAGGRGALPVVTDGGDAVTSPALSAVARLAIRALAHDRLLAACGAILRETA